MATSALLDIKTTVALYLGKQVSDLTIGGFDLGLVALNQVRRRAELAHDFEFSRKLVSLAVNGVTGGNLSAAVLVSDGVTIVDTKTVIEVGVFDDSGNLRPITWTTVAEGLERQRKDNRRVFQGWRETEYTQVQPRGVFRVEFSGMDCFVWPKDSQNNYTLGLEVYAMQAPWTDTNLTTTTFSDNWTKYGAEYLTWAAIEHLNLKFKFLAPRTEGNLPPPTALAAQALDAFIEWDTNLYEEFRRHSR